VLVRLKHPLAESDGARAERHQSAVLVVQDVVAELNGLPVCASDPGDIRAAIVRFLNSGAGTAAALEANQILFDCALPILVKQLEFDPVAVATSLHRRLGRDVESAMNEARASGMLRPTTIQALDRSRLPSGFTKRELQIIAALATGASRSEISSRLFISPKTLQNHISRISDKIDGRGERGILARARAAGALLAIPAMFISVALGDGITALQDLA
jgi:DNA-binding CsgD family transcriptional regulator